MAIADFGGEVNGKKIELLVADHQNKADIAASKSREWIDQQNVDVLIGGTNSGVALAMNKVAAERKKPIIVVSAGTARLTNEECTPYTVHYSYDTISLAKVVGSAIAKQGGDSWYFLTADYAFGASLEKDASDVVRANGGKVVGSVKHPLNASDFASFLLQAQSSKAQILGLANSGGDNGFFSTVIIAPCKTAVSCQKTVYTKLLTPPPPQRRHVDLRTTPPSC